MLIAKSSYLLMRTTQLSKCADSIGPQNLIKVAKPFQLMTSILMFKFEPSIVFYLRPGKVLKKRFRFYFSSSLAMQTKGCDGSTVRRNKLEAKVNSTSVLEHFLPSLGQLFGYEPMSSHCHCDWHAT